MKATLCVLSLLLIPGLPRLSAATERFALPSACFDPDNHSLPKVDRGMLLCYKKWAESPSGEPNIFVFDSNGHQTASHRLWLDGAMKVEIKDVAVTPSGAIVAVGSAISVSGSMSGYLVTMTGSQPAVPAVQLKTPIPYQVCAASDGSFWTLMGPRRDFDGDDKAYNTLFHFNSDGHVSGEYLPTSGFKTPEHPAVPTNEGLPRLFCGRSGASAYIPASGEWITVDGSGNVVTHVQVALIPFVKTSQFKIPLKYAQMYGMAMTESGAVYGSFQDERGPMSFRLDRSSLTWSRVHPENTAEGKIATLLLGADRDSLVYEVCYHDGSEWGIAWAAQP